MQGVVTKSTGSWYSVRMPDHKVYHCRTKGKLRLEESKNTNPVAVGDIVTIEQENETEASIVSIEPRRNYIIRKSTNLSKQHHVIASNIDQLILVITLFHPQTSLAFIDRYLITAEAYKIKPVLVFNKVDLYVSDEEHQALIEVEKIYQTIGYQTIKTSVLQNIGLDELKNTLRKKTSLFSGHSGVGKSSLLQHIEPAFTIKIGEISSAHHKGKHTTTYAEMFSVLDDAYIIDTPGIKSFGLTKIEPEFLAHYFPEIFIASHDCKFHNCKHIQEPHCAVLKAVENNKIAVSRYENYCAMYLDEKEKYRL